MKPKKKRNQSPTKIQVEIKTLEKIRTPGENQNTWENKNKPGEKKHLSENKTPGENKTTWEK
ncbi:hypothetical protein HYE31_03920 [Mycoplasmopsis bovis]|nr:hypothetical protein HYE31_03920 [Mycoplasmopsis bovis]